MDKKIIIAPSRLAADFSKLKEEITEVEKPEKDGIQR